MKGYHVDRHGTLSKLIEEGKNLWYTTHTDSGWFVIEKDIGLRDKGKYDVYEVDIPKSSLTTSIEPNPKKIFVLTRENWKDFKKKYNVTFSGFDIDQAKDDFAGVDGNDKSLWRTSSYMAINGGPPSGVVWRIKGTGIKVKRVDNN